MYRVPKGWTKIQKKKISEGHRELEKTKYKLKPQAYNEYNIHNEKNWIEIDELDPRFIMFEKTFVKGRKSRYYMTPELQPYQITSVIGVKQLEYDDVYLVYVDSKKCYNLVPEDEKYGEHSNRNIYFYVTHNFMIQKCTCNCETTKDRRNGISCKDWKGKRIDTIPSSLNMCFDTLRKLRDRKIASRGRINGIVVENIDYQREYMTYLVTQGQLASQAFVRSFSGTGKKPRTIKFRYPPDATTPEKMAMYRSLFLEKDRSYMQD